ncbi:hypothetical protein [Shewanella insulae]|uniref:hypothetical protein n=1 Tax=Shewanella insulae TaxID=2681496 RepID=UPI00248118FA|nr:hypothetical protein [Shewanella insulae]
MEIYEIEFNGDKLKVEAQEKKAMWGNGVQLSIFKLDGSLLNKISYSSHPDFDNFEL